MLHRMFAASIRSFGAVWYLPAKDSIPLKGSGYGGGNEGLGDGWVVHDCGAVGPAGRP